MCSHSQLPDGLVAQHEEEVAAAAAQAKKGLAAKVAAHAPQGLY